MLFYDLILSPVRYFVPFWIGEFFFFGRFLNCRQSGLSASFTRVSIFPHEAKYLLWLFCFW